MASRVVSLLVLYCGITVVQRLKMRLLVYVGSSSWVVGAERLLTNWSMT
jgi:hypothetical protein